MLAGWEEIVSLIGSFLQMARLHLQPPQTSRWDTGSSFTGPLPLSFRNPHCWAEAALQAALTTTVAIRCASTTAQASFPVRGGICCHLVAVSGNGGDGLVALDYTLLRDLRQAQSQAHSPSPMD
ncbi:unnamed protein product [Gadus morhua 'NCC']